MIVYGSCVKEKRMCLVQFKKNAAYSLGFYLSAIIPALRHFVYGIKLTQKSKFD